MADFSVDLLESDGLITRPLGLNRLDAAEFELDEELMEEMKQKEEEIQRRFRESLLSSTFQQTIKERKDEKKTVESFNSTDNSMEINSVDRKSVPSSSSDGYVAVVNISIHLLNSNDLIMRDEDSENDIVRVDLKVFQRFVPHQTVAAREKLKEIEDDNEENNEEEEEESSDSNDSSNSEDSDSNSDTDLDVNAADAKDEVLMSGNYDEDVSALQRLMGMDIYQNADQDEDLEKMEGKEFHDQLKQKQSLLKKDFLSVEMLESEEEDAAPLGPLRTKNEIPLSTLPPPAEFSLSENDQILYCGVMTAVVEDLLIVRSAANTRALDIGSAVCLEDKLAAVEGSQIYFVPSLSSFVLADTTPGSDASNPHDEEIDPEQQEFSDDEKEAEAKAARTKAKKQQQIKNQPLSRTSSTFSTEKSKSLHLPTRRSTQLHPQNTIQQSNDRQSPYNYQTSTPLSSSHLNHSSHISSLTASGDYSRGFPSISSFQPQQYSNSAPFQMQQHYAPFSVQRSHNNNIDTQMNSPYYYPPMNQYPSHLHSYPYQTQTLQQTPYCQASIQNYAAGTPANYFIPPPRPPPPPSASASAPAPLNLPTVPQTKYSIGSSTPFSW